MPQYVRGLDEIFSLRLEKPKLYPWVAKEVLTLLFHMEVCEGFDHIPQSKTLAAAVAKDLLLELLQRNIVGAIEYHVSATEVRVYSGLVGTVSVKKTCVSVNLQPNFTALLCREAKQKRAIGKRLQRVMLQQVFRQHIHELPEDQSVYRDFFSGRGLRVNLNYPKSPCTRFRLFSTANGGMQILWV